MPPLDAATLARMPGLKAVVHAAGSVKHHVTDACWDRGIRVSTAAAANAVPVAEYTLAAILFANKRVPEIGGLYREHRAALDWAAHYPGFGNYRRTIGLVGASLVGRRVLELLRPHDFGVLLADPHLDPAGARSMGARLVGLDEMLAVCGVVSLHAPALPETHHLLDARRLSLLRDGATLVNTGRGSLVDTDALTAEASSGRIHAVLDVTEPEVLPATSPLYSLPNVLLTPHIAGSLGGELQRITRSALDEVERYCRRRGVRPRGDPRGPDHLGLIPRENRSNRMPPTGHLSGVLVYTRTTAYRHDSIPAARTALRELGEEEGFTVETSEDPAVFTDASLAGRGAVVFLSTSGEVLTEDGRAALQRWITDGGGFMGVHSAACTEYDWPYYGELLGARFGGHPAFQPGTVLVENRKHPATAHLAGAVGVERRVVRLPDRPAPPGRAGPRHRRRDRLRGGGMGADHPLVWCKDSGAGRSFYTALGHADEAYSDPAFRRHLLGGLCWAAGVTA